MSQLMLFAGFKHGTDVSKLKGYIRATFPEHTICQVWMDPYMDPRAVVLFDKELELKEIQNKSSGETSAELPRYVDVAKPTESVFVKTYQSMDFGTKDKLKYLFTSRRNGGSKVLKVEQLKTADNDCYEISFLNWDAVLMACKHTWKVESQTLTVIPYFESFKEPVNQQLQRLIELNNTTKQVVTANKGSTLSSSSAKWELNKARLKPLPPQPFYTTRIDVKATQHATKSLIKTESKNQEHKFSLTSEPSVSDLTSDQQEKKIITTVKQSKPPSENKADLKHAKPLLEHPYILMLLHLLNFEKAVQNRFSAAMVTIHESTWEVEITGPFASVKKIQKMLTEEDELDNSTLFENFLVIEAVQHDLKAFIDSGGFFVDIVDTNGKPHMQVKNAEGKKESFQDFISSLVIAKECHSLPTEQSQDHTVWRDFMQTFKSAYSHQHIFVNKKYVILVSLAKRSQDIDVILNIINNTIVQLKAHHSLGLKSGSCAETVAHPDEISQENLTSNDSSQSSADTSSVQTKTGSKSKKMIICLQNSFFLWILNALNMKEAVKQRTSSLVTDIDEEEKEIIISGTEKLVEDLKPVLVAEDKKLPFKDHEQEFLYDANIQQQLKSYFTESGCHIVLDDNLEMSVANQDGKKESLMTFLISVIQFRKCLHLPEKFHTSKEWTTLIDQIKQQHSPHHIIVADEEVYLVTIAHSDASHDADMIVEKINRNISTQTSSVSHELALNDNCEQHNIFFSCPEMKIKYFNKFLESDLYKIQAHYQEVYRSVINISEDGFNICSLSKDINNKMQVDLEQALEKIERVEKEFRFPGLVPYLKSIETSLIVNLQDKYKCLIEIPNKESSYFQSVSMNEEQSSKSLLTPEYKVALLGTAYCNGFNIHFVQGDIQDLNLEMKVEVQPSDTVELCEVRGKKSSQNLILQLPRWSAPSETMYHTHFEKLRSSFEEAVCLVLGKAELIKVTSIAFSTTQLDVVEKPFPAGVIAQVLVEKLYERCGSGSASQRENGSHNIYICDTRKEAIFKAFTFFLKLQGAYVSPPNQASWDKVCFQESYNYPDYSSLLKPKSPIVEVVFHTPSWMGNKMCIFYPIHPTLEIDTCPAVKDPKSAHFKLKASLSDLRQQNPDGLLACEMFPLQGFHDGRKAFVYCSPDWGMDCKKAIEMTVEECLKKSAESEEIYIVPPGMQLLSKYPVAYLAQTLFRKLDSLIQNQQLSGQMKKIVLLVQDAAYKKVFDQELQKRHPKREGTGYFQMFKNIWHNWSSPKDKEKMYQEEVQQSTIRESFVPETKIRFWGTNDLYIQNAAVELDKYLKDMMKTNRRTLKLNTEETQRLQHLLKDIQDFPIQITYQEQYEWQKNRTKEGKKEYSDPEMIVLSGSDLALQGLSKNSVDEFLNLLGVGRDMEVLERKIKKEGAQVTTSISLKVTGEPLESVSYFSENDSQQKEDILFNNEDASGDVPVEAPTQVACYKWMYEANPGVSFVGIGDIGNVIEAAYAVEMVDSKNLRGEFTHVDFTSMTVEEANLKGIIRTEVFESVAPEISVPKEWTSMLGREFRLVKLGTEMEDFKQIYSELLPHLKQHNLAHQVQISRIQNKSLYTRYVQKSSQMKFVDHTRMWHRVLRNCMRLVCRYGFHPRFSGMPDAKHLGDGVLFYEDPDKCLNPSVDSEEEICLISTNVLVGKSGSGEPKLRCPPSDKITGETYDSVCEDGAYMIFSDAQAYPVYAVTLKIK